MIKKIFVAASIGCALSYAAEFKPNEDAGMVKVSVDGASLQNVLSVYENAGYHDFGTTENIEGIEEIKKVNQYYLYDWRIGLVGNDIEFDMKGVMDANARKVVGFIPFHPHVHTSGIRGRANAFFKDFGLSDDGKVHLNVCLTNADIDINRISYGYGLIMDQLIINGVLDVDGTINSQAQSAVDNALADMTQSTNCIDFTDHIGAKFPEFASSMEVAHAGTNVENGNIIAYGCPVKKRMVGEAVYVSDAPCESVTYDILVYTAKEIDHAGTDANITLKLCGDDPFGINKCIVKTLDHNTEVGQKSHLRFETTKVLATNLSMTLESDNSGKKPGWYVDSVTVNMALPNNAAYHYWFPVHAWIGDTSPKTFTFKQSDNLQVYTFKVQTGDESHFDHAGTDSYIVATVCDVYGKCLSFNLNKDNYDDFEAGDIDTYSIVTNEKLAEVKTLTLHNIYSEDHPGWYVKDVWYSHYSFPENIDHSLKDGQGFMFRQWLARGETKDAFYTETTDNLGKWLNGQPVHIETVNSSFLPVIYDIHATRKVEDNFGYYVEIKTQSGGSSGTDATILLTLEGCSGETEVFDLNDDVNNFEKGDLDIFQLSGVKDLKGIKKISLYNDGANDGPGWNPEWITVRPETYYGPTLLGYDATSGIGVYNRPYNFPITDAIGKKQTWTSGELSCPDVLTPSIVAAAPEVHPGDYVKFYGYNLSENLDFTLKLAVDVKPVSVTRDYVMFRVPDDTPFGDYVGDVVNGVGAGAVFINGSVQLAYVKVRGQKPVLDGIAIKVAEPGSAFEATIRNITASSLFYLGNIQLKTLSLSKNSVVLQIPRDMEDGVYRFRALSNGWDVTYDETIEIINSKVPHVSSISETVVYTGQVVDIVGKNFGDDAKSIKVMVGDKEAEIKSLDNEKITISIPTGVSGKDVVVTVTREDITAPEKLTIEIKSLPWFMSFDDPERPWTCDNAELTLDNTVKYGDFGYSLKIHGEGYKYIVSPVFNTYELGAVSDELLIDIWVPEEQTNPYWKGDVQLSVNIPAAGLYNAWVGQVLLTDLEAGWNTLSFKLNQDVYNAFAGDYPNATIAVILNANQNAEDFRIDNMRFGGDINLRTNEHVVAGTIVDVYSVDFMSFDNINDWNIAGQNLLFVESPKMEGLGATGIIASGFSELKSRSFTPSELDYVSNTISMDVYVPNPQPNDYWVGDISMTLNCPDSDINSLYLGRVDLTHMFREEYNNVQFSLPDEAVAALRYGVGECSFSIYLNVNNGAGMFLFDNMGFVNILQVAGR